MVRFIYENKKGPAPIAWAAWAGAIQLESTREERAEVLAAINMKGTSRRSGKGGEELAT